MKAAAGSAGPFYDAFGLLEPQLEAVAVELDEPGSPLIVG